MDELKPCNLRQVDIHGRILCNAIKGGDREVSVQLCRACPVSQINCQNLRAGLEKKVSTPITVRFATGRVEVWDDAPPQIDFKQAACAAKTMPIHSPRDCAGCPIRIPNIIPQNAIQVAHRAKQNAPAVAQPAPIAQAAPAARAVRGTARGTRPVSQPTAEIQPPVVAQAAPQPVAAQAAQPVARPQRAPVTHAPMPAQAVAQMPVAAQSQAIAQPQARTEYAAGVDLGAAADLIARAQATAARKAQEKRIQELEAQLAAQTKQTQEAQQTQPAATSETKSKIIQMQDWLASQVNKKQNGEKRANDMYKPQAVAPDADGVSDIIYAPLGAQMSAAYQETIDYERCVGWTD